MDVYNGSERFYSIFGNSSKHFHLVFYNTDHFHTQLFYFLTAALEKVRSGLLMSNSRMTVAKKNGDNMQRGHDSEGQCCSL